MKLCVFLLFALIVGNYCNCGCLNCNKHFQVLSPPGARVKIIHRSIPCTCPTSLPYSVEIPRTPSSQVTWGRSYGYEVQAERRQPEKPVDPCPIQQEYDCQMQIPHQRAPKYLVGLVASTDRIVLESPQRPLPRVCQHPIIERFSIPTRRIDDDVPRPHPHPDPHSYLRYCLCPTCVNARTSSQRIIWKPKPQRSKRSINYKLLALNTNNFQVSNKRKSLTSRRFAQDNKKDVSLPQFVMVPNDTTKRGPILGVKKILGSKKKSVARRRFKRNVSFFESDEETNEIEERSKNRRRAKNASKRAEALPTTMQSMPLLKMLSLPLKYISNVHDNPIVGAIPKVLRVSRKCFMNFAKNFVDDYKKIKRKKAIHKRLHKREVSFDYPEENCGCGSFRRKREISQTPTHQQLLVGVLKDLAKKSQKTEDAYYKFSDVDDMSWDDIVKELQQIAIDHNEGHNKNVAEEFLSILKEVAKEEQENKSRNKRETSLLQDVLKFLKAERLPAIKKKRSIPELETNTLKDEILKATKRVQKLIEGDFSEDLYIFDHLLKLQNLKEAVVNQHQAKANTLAKIKESEELKEMVLQEIIVKIAKNEDECVGKWIKIIIYLQKFHCALQSLTEKPSKQVLQVLSSIKFVKGSTQGELLKNLKARQNAKTQSEVEFLNGLKLLLASNNEGKLKEESALIWQSNNLKKLQRDSIVKMVEKLVKKQRIRQELKILFDLQKQLEKCHEKQKQLLGEAITSRLPKDQILMDKQLEIYFESIA